MDTFLNVNVENDLINDNWLKFNNTDSNLQLYLHSIYCGTRCSYCDCKTFIKGDKNDFLKYKEYIIYQINYYGKIIKKPLNSIYFGGGTFNIWPDDYIIEICDEIKKNFKFDDKIIWQVEIQPYYLSENTLNILKSYGVTDIMLGIQTFSEKVNKLNNRSFDLNKIDLAINNIINLNFRKVSFDMMYNLPYMTASDLISDMEKMYEYGIKLKNNNINVNFEPNRWDISMRTTFGSLFLNKYGKEKFLDICNYYIKNSQKLVRIVDKYIDNKFIGLFDTKREEIEERKVKNTAILGIGLTSTSHIPGKLVYEDLNYSGWKQNTFKYKGYILDDSDIELFYILENLNITRGINKDIFYLALKKHSKLNDFYIRYSSNFKINEIGNIYVNFNSDKELDLLNIYLINDDIRDKQLKKILDKWLSMGFNTEELEYYNSIFLDYYYDRNKFYG
ncbi:MAG: radical SAM protein [Candidatus Gracilibacteria bacterium]|nr:radical SAM protein [Candidatus Gracilibacteria bacterium]